MAVANVPPRTASRQDDLRTLLRVLNLTRMEATVAEVALKAAKEGLTHEAFLYELARQEDEYRTHRRIERRLRESGLPREKTFRTLQLERFTPALQLAIERLRAGAFVADAVNIVAVGRPGVGKTHKAPNLAHDGGRNHASRALAVSTWVDPLSRLGRPVHGLGHNRSAIAVRARGHPHRSRGGPR